MKIKKMNILLATGVYPPDIGGPATYISALQERFPNYDINVKILTYGEEVDKPNVFFISRKDNLLSRYVQYLKKLWKIRKWVQIVYAFDQVSTGVPCAVFKFIQPQKKFIIRLGGDFLWEKAYNNAWTKVSLSKYYQQKKNIKEKIFIWIYNFVFGRSDQIIFSTKWQKAIYLDFFRKISKKSIVIENAFPLVENDVKNYEVRKQILVIGRLVRLKNIEIILKIAQDLKNFEFLIVGDGPDEDIIKHSISKYGIDSRVKLLPGVSHQESLRMIQKSYLVIVPAISEVSPNTVLEAIKLEKPVIVTKECGFLDSLGESIEFFDPLNKKELVAKINFLIMDENYNKYIERLKSVDTSRSWENVILNHIDIFKKLNWMPK